MFRNLLGFEFHSAYAASPGFGFAPESAAVRKVLGGLHGAGDIVWTALLVLGVVLSARALRRGWRGRREGLPWIPIWFFFQLAAVFIRLVLMSPAPFVEPRHNLDLALLLVLSAFFAVDALARSVRWTRAWTAGIVLLALLLGLPSAFYFHKTARFKRISYKRIVNALRDNGVKYLAADFSLAYVIHFLTGRAVEKSGHNRPPEDGGRHIRDETDCGCRPGRSEGVLLHPPFSPALPVDARAEPPETSRAPQPAS